MADVAFSSVDKRVVDGEVAVELCNYTDVFYNRHIRLDTKFMAATATPAECHRWSLRKGDVLFTKDSETPDEIGIPSYVSDDMPNVLCGYHLGLARPFPGLIHGQYLAMALGTRASGRELARIANGVTRFGLTLKATRSLPILLPPLAEQRAIAAVLDAIDEAIERTEAVAAATERLRDALLHALLTRGVPGRHSAWKDAPGIGTIPASWEVVRLGDVVEVNRSQWDPMEGSSILYLDLTAVPAPGRLASPIRMAAEDAPSRARRRVQAGDILVSTVRPYLRGFVRVVEAPQNLIASTGFAVLTPLPKADRSLVYHHVMALPFVQHLEASMTGQAYPAVRPSDVASYRFALPPLPEQRTIASLLDSADEAVTRGRAETDVLRSLKASAADALLTGRVRWGRFSEGAKSAMIERELAFPLPLPWSGESFQARYIGAINFLVGAERKRQVAIRSLADRSARCPLACK